jgi:anti-sigma B factor antagonist
VTLQPVVSGDSGTGAIGELNSFTPTFAIDLASPGAGSVRIEVRGDVDLSTSPELDETLRRALDAGNSVVLDLSEVTFIDSTGLNTLIRALKACETNGGALALTTNLPAQVSRVFEITGLDDLFPTVPL